MIQNSIIGSDRGGHGAPRAGRKPRGPGGSWASFTIVLIWINSIVLIWIIIVLIWINGLIWITMFYYVLMFTMVYYCFSMDCCVLLCLNMFYVFNTLFVNSCLVIRVIHWRLQTCSNLFKCVLRLSITCSIVCC